ncbi:MAG: hypothetical protein WBA12_11620 [Catalinimonas sp.]
MSNVLLTGLLTEGTTDAAFEAFHNTYERQHFRYTPANQKVGESTLRVFQSWYPTFLHPLVRQGTYALMDAPLRAAFGFPDPHPVVGWPAPRALTLRKHVLRLLPGRRRPYHFTKVPNRTYKQGYDLEKLGPEGAAESAHAYHV